MYLDSLPELFFFDEAVYTTEPKIIDINLDFVNIKYKKNDFDFWRLGTQDYCSRTSKSRLGELSTIESKAYRPLRIQRPQTGKIRRTIRSPFLQRKFASFLRIQQLWSDLFDLKLSK